MLELVAQGMGVGVALAAPIGPINIEIVRRGLLGGFVSGWLVGLGAVTADTIYCMLVVAGLTPVADDATLRVPLFLAGGAVLGYLGWGSIRTALAGNLGDAGTVTARRSYAAGFVMAAANPMGIVYWLSVGAALVASAVERSGRDGAPVLVTGVFVGIVCWVTVLATLTQGGRRFASPSVLRWITGLSGVTLLGFGVSFFMRGVNQFG